MNDYTTEVNDTQKSHCLTTIKF